MDYENIPLDKYIEEKIYLLTTEFNFKLAKSEINHLKELKSEIAVDQYARTLFDRYLS